ncbi:MAG: DNA (cytosine-5-)-methyltransferase [Bacteroidales bacterium]|nr:DNA (cytosine-5-)-methyltransferase [Bacteroidales bacterium]
MPDYQETQAPPSGKRKLRVLSLFSGCGGMDLGLEGGFIAPRKSFPKDSKSIAKVLDDDWVMLRRTRLETVFANDILPEAATAWKAYMSRYGRGGEIYSTESVVNLVKRHAAGEQVFPADVDIVTGGFPCQDFSLAGKRMGFNSGKSHDGKRRTDDEPSEETRGKLYFWMKQVIDATRPKVFIAENVKGLVSLGDVKEIIQRDFASAGNDGYVVLTPRVLHAADYGVPENRERVIFIGLRRDALRPEALKALEGDADDAFYDPYPAPSHAYTKQDDSLLPPVTTDDVLHSLREPGESVDPAQNVFSKAKYLPKGQGQTEIRKDGIGPTIRSEHHGNIEFRRLAAEHGGRHADELAAGLAERRLTPRECALIQTFPPDYPFIIPERRLSSTGAYKVIGNAVPPVLAFKIAERIEEFWEVFEF